MNTNPLYVAIITLAASSIESPGAVLFSQSFDTSSTLADYFNAGAPSSEQWNTIGSTGSEKIWSISSNALQMESTGANSAFASRTTDFAVAPQALQMRFDFSLTSTSSIVSAVQFFFGSGMNTNNVNPNNEFVHSKFGLNFTDTGSFSVRDVSSGTDGATMYATGNSYTITFVTNNSGMSMTYMAPDGSIESLADDTWDLWVGTSKELNERTATTSSLPAITDFKFGVPGDKGGNYTFRIDNLQIFSIPEPRILLLGSLGVLRLLHRRRRSFGGK